ncbi:MAG: acetate--CoA ligase family protein [Mangrovibacterium sp.]
MTIHSSLFQPGSIAVVGASNQLSKPGGRLLQNLLLHHGPAQLFAVNPNETTVQGVTCVSSVAGLPPVDLAFLAIPAAACVPAMEILAAEKNTRAFVVLSAGFSESGDEGKRLEHQLVAIANRYGASLIGPNCIGLITPCYAGVFTTPVPGLSASGVDFISGSGATAVFTIESGMQKGLRFASVFSVGNSAQIGVEEVLEHLDIYFDPESSARVKLLYLEAIRDPQKLLRHARSLVQKGCRIAAVKAGTGQSGARAAQSHTGALASPDEMVDALFRKAGIVRCYGREELTTVAGVLLQPGLSSPSLAIVTHAGGPAVMLTDVLEKGGIAVPRFPDSVAKTRLLSKLFPGSSAENPIDILATGTAGQLEEVIQACNNDFDAVAGIVVIFGSPGLSPVNEVYRLLANNITLTGKPIFAVLPSVVNAADAIREFTNAGHFCFPDEVELGKALARVASAKHLVSEFSSPCTNLPNPELVRLFTANFKPGFLPARQLHALLDAGGIPRSREDIANTEGEAQKIARRIGFPVAMKVVGPLHKSDVGGVLLNVSSDDELRRGFRRLMQLEGAQSVLVSEMLAGTELYIGAKYEPGYGHLLMFGLGGIWLEAMKDIQSLLVPVTPAEAERAIEQLKGLPVLQGKRGQQGISLDGFAGLVCRVSALLELLPEIKELDLNPVFAQNDVFRVADVRIRVEWD